MDKDEKAKEKASYDELAILKSAIEKIPIAISIADAKGDHFYHNKAFTLMFGFNIEEYRSKPAETLYADPKENQNITGSVSRGEKWTGKVEMIGKSGKTFPVSLQAEAIKDENNTIISFQRSYTDISESKVIERELTCQQEYLSTLRSISLGMFRRLNLSDLLNAIMERAEKITQIPNGFLHIYNPDQNVLELRAAFGILSPYVGFKIESGKGFAGKIFKSGEPMILENFQTWPEATKEAIFKNSYAMIGIPLVSGSKNVGVIGLSYDAEDKTIDLENITILEEFAAIAQIAIDNATLFEGQRQEIKKCIVLEKERKEMEARLHHSQRMESIGTLAGGIAHDFNNILTAIMGFTQIAQGDAKKGSVLEDDLNEIYIASIRAKDLTQQILTFARQSEESINKINISAIVKEVLKFIRSSIPSTISIEQNIKSTSKVLANPTQVYQMFLNLFTNAAQAMKKDGGNLKVDLTEDVVETHESIEQGNYIRISISDTGEGIAREHINSIFEPYFTTKQMGEGTGLGLSVVHGAVKSMGGEIFVESYKGKGTTFILYFPIVKEQSFKIESDHEEKDIPLGNQEHVLFIDDEISILKAIKRLLEEQNYKVTILDNSLEALDLFKSNPNVFDVVMSDIVMPDMTGDKLVRELMKIRPDIPIILCTGHHQYMTDKEVAEKGINSICYKPISRMELAQTIRSAIDSST
ncbi:MAG: response regulator [Desulfobacteraceae bacterium]|nr:response regulator [Desulfobacteraceae bacterium]